LRSDKSEARSGAVPTLGFGGARVLAPHRAVLSFEEQLSTYPLACIWIVLGAHSVLIRDASRPK
jgi:hypothetical protein